MFIVKNFHLVSYFCCCFSLILAMQTRLRVFRERKINHGEKLGIWYILIAGVAVFFSDLAPRLGCWLAAKTLHNCLLDNVLHAPLLFTDTNPLGRILSRFTKDNDVLDNTLPMIVSGGLYCFFDVCLKSLELICACF